MCWIGRKNTKQVAKRDFYVYKIGLVINNTFTSLFQKYIYRIKRSNPIISEALTKALNDPDRDPLVFFRPEKNTGDNTDGQKAHFALSFGENAYKSKLMEEVY